LLPLLQCSSAACLLLTNLVPTAHGLLLATHATADTATAAAVFICSSNPQHKRKERIKLLAQGLCCHCCSACLLPACCENATRAIVQMPPADTAAAACVPVSTTAEHDPQHKRKERIKLLERKGFVKIAVETGLDGGIIPVYHFGNTQVGRQYVNCWWCCDVC
jgi:hypothetical protein